jgi:hypothetical protein
MTESVWQEKVKCELWTKRKCQKNSNPNLCDFCKYLHMYCISYLRSGEKWKDFKVSKPLHTSFMNSAKQIDNVDTIDTTVSELATVHWRLLLE